MAWDTVGSRRFVEQLLVLLDQGAYTATYKFAVLLAIIDVCLESTDERGWVPSTVSVRDLAEKTVGLYWPQTGPFPGRADAVILRQNSGGQAAVVSAIREHRDSMSADGLLTLHTAKVADPGRWDRLIDVVAWKLVQMPLPRLQRLGGRENRFLYDYDWSTEISRSEFRRGEVGKSIELHPGVGDLLVSFNSLIRPLVHRRWAELVARFNPDAVDELRLESFLFGADRKAVARLANDLTELQHGRCFYCRAELGAKVEVDHFIPWSRHPDDSLQNLVVAHGRCNGDKRDFLAASLHLARWVERNEKQRSDLESVASSRSWIAGGNTAAVARAIYSRIPEGSPLWIRSDDFESARSAAIRDALGITALDLAADEAGAYKGS